MRVRIGRLAVAGLVACMGTSGSAAEVAEVLFSAASLEGSARSGGVRGNGREDVESGNRQRHAAVALDVLADVRARAQRGVSGGVRLNLLDGVEFTAVDVTVEPTLSGYSYAGRLEGVPFGTAVLVQSGGRVAGTVRTPSTTYSIRPTDDGVSIRETADERLECGTVLEGPASRGPDASGRWRGLDSFRNALQSDAEDESVVDVLVVYTEEARRQAGGADEIGNYIDLAVAEAN